MPPIQIALAVMNLLVQVVKFLNEHPEVGERVRTDLDELHRRVGDINENLAKRAHD